MLCLGLETADLSPGVGLARDGRILWELFEANPRSKAQAIFEYLARMKSEGRLVIGDLDLIAVTVGPGSFTGLKVGLAAAKGLAYSQGLKVVPVSSLAALAAGVAEAYPGCLIVPILDARRGLIYTALFEAGRGEVVRLEEDQAADPEAWVRSLDRLDGGKRIVFVGEGLKTYGRLFEERLGGRVEMARPEDWRISPGWVALLGMRAAETAQDPFVVEANYIRPVEAKKPAKPLV